MADVKGIPMHKRMAAGEKISGMRKGGATKGKDCGPMMKKGGKVKKGK